MEERGKNTNEKNIYRINVYPIIILLPKGISIKRDKLGGFPFSISNF